ncbi:MCE family protein, partial [Gordonia alkanivorans]|nr:MCE family protein [Gordonia alkanivorans]
SGPTALSGAIPLVQTSSTYDISNTLETTTPVFRDVNGVDLRQTAALLQNAFSDGNTDIPDALRNTSSLMDLLER